MTDKTQTKAVSNAPLTDEEFAEKYNRGHKIIDFVGHKKIFFGISLAIIIIGIVCNFIFGTQLDIQFSGGATLKFSYSGEINQSELTDFIQVETTEDRITTTYAQDLMGDSGTTVTVQFSGNDSIKTDIRTITSNVLNQIQLMLQWVSASFSSVLLLLQLQPCLWFFM